MIENPWYKNAVVYNLDLETFMDASGDGDLEGPMRRPDHLHPLGVDTARLEPFQPPPNRGDGYDVTSFYGGDPRGGSSGDPVAFMEGFVSAGYGHRWFRVGGLNDARSRRL